jgi:hypothetical protein
VERIYLWFTSMEEATEENKKTHLSQNSNPILSERESGALGAGVAQSI